MEAVEAEWLEAVLRRWWFEQSVVKVLSAETTPALAKGENYMSRMLRVRARVVLGSGRQETRSFMVKRRNEFTTADGKLFEPEYKLFFNSEHRIYAEILPQIETVLKENGDPDYKLWADCMGFVKSTDICFSDLKAQGFRMGDRKNGLDLDHITLAMRNLGKLHAASAVAVSQSLFDPQTLRPHYTGRKDPVLEAIFKGSFDLLSQVILQDWSSEWQPMGKKMEALKDTIMDELAVLVHAKVSSMKVVNHGDFWVNNFMFKYDHEEKPTDLRFVDFQTVHYNTAGWDLTYLLYTSVQPALREAHLDRLLATYRESVAATLGLLGGGLAAPTLEQVRGDLARLRLYALAVTVTLLPVIMTSSEADAIGAEDLFATDKQEKTRVLLNNPKYVEAIKISLLETFPELQ